ncbi:hypothetical protein KIW84_053528 [Lathyrus oleraceus]|uniref:Helicase ATP-binding domain-containing protein n=2 Tax=Pisum sativum TaxID=3888 RepID=A0A9D4WV62_PEA|nr:hypothetical protein KIW84_053528 [Pisum sativum]
MLLLPTTTEPIFLRPRIHHLSIAPLTDHVAEAVTVMVLHVISLDPNNNNRRGTSTTTTILLIGTIALRLSPALSQKTASFCFPIISGIMKDRLGSGLSAMPHGGGSDVAYPTALILSPTRELSCQIHAEANKFAYQTGVKIAVAYGGAPIGQQLRVLERGVDILVATPGRLVDMIERERVSLKKIKYLALDEADRMLDMGFEHQIRNIVQQMNMPAPGARQTLLFSATFPDNIQKLASDFLSNYVFLAVGRVGSSTELIVQKIESVQDMEKRNRLVDLLRRNVVNGKLALSLIFVETKKGADALESWLCRSGFPAIAIHGDKALAQCRMVLNDLGVDKVRDQDTAVAAKTVAINCVRHTGAIASSRAAEIYGLDILAEGIQVITFAIAQLGWIAGPSMMLLFAFIIYYTSTLLSVGYRTGDQLNGKRNYTYTQAVRAYLGGYKVKLCGIVLMLRQRHIVNRLQNSTVSGKNELSYAKQVGFFRPIIGGSVTYNDQPYSKFLKSSLDSTSALGIVQMLHDIAVVCIYQFKGRVVNVGFKRLEKSLSFFGFAARKAVSATAFTVTGVVNKFLTVAINVTIWDKHASPAGLVCLLFTIIGGVLYQQSVTGNCSMLSV